MPMCGQFCCYYLFLRAWNHWSFLTFWRPLQTCPSNSTDVIEGWTNNRWWKCWAALDFTAVREVYHVRIHHVRNAFDKKGTGWSKPGEDYQLGIISLIWRHIMWVTLVQRQRVSHNTTHSQKNQQQHSSITTTSAISLIKHKGKSSTSQCRLRQIAEFLTSKFLYIWLEYALFNNPLISTTMGFGQN